LDAYAVQHDQTHVELDWAQSAVEVNVSTKFLDWFRSEMSAPVDPVADAYQRWWDAKRAVLRAVRARVAADLAFTPVFAPATVGRTFTPVVDLACSPQDGYGWVPDGLASSSTPQGHVLAHGTLARFDHGEQEQGPGGPGENLCWFTVDASPARLVQGSLAVPYDMRWPFGAILGEALLVDAREPILANGAGMAAIETDIRVIIEHAPVSIWRSPWPRE
jgi:hypothetical protein